jgi:hypothetical protein
MSIGRFVPPDSDTATAASSLVREDCDPFLVAHCERSLLFARLLAERDGCDLDLEVLHVGVLLHDMGLSSRHQGPERFEVRGANLAREMLTELAWHPERIANVWDVIALHTSREIARHKTPETDYANQGISLDIRGRAPDGLDTDDVRAVLDLWPRATFPNDMSDALIAEVRARPDSTRSTWMEHIAATHVEGFEHPDFIAALRATTEFT